MRRRFGAVVVLIASTGLAACVGGIRDEFPASALIVRNASEEQVILVLTNGHDAVGGQAYTVDAGSDYHEATVVLGYEETTARALLLDSACHQFKSFSLKQGTYRLDVADLRAAEMTAVPSWRTGDYPSLSAAPEDCFRSTLPSPTIRGSVDPRAVTHVTFSDAD